MHQREAFDTAVVGFDRDARACTFTYMQACRSRAAPGAGGTPISTEGLRYGLRVAILALPAHPMLKTSEALSMVGPAAFGYTCSYEPFNARFRGL
jgi:hypothetical protein